MSDFLTRLSARALGVADEVRPATLPMFSLAPVSAPLLAPAEGADEPGGRAAEILERNEEPLAAAPVSAPARTAAPSGPAAKHFENDSVRPRPRARVPTARASSAPNLAPALRPKHDDTRPSSPPFRADSGASAPAGGPRQDRNQHAVDALRVDSRAGPAGAATPRAIKPSALAAALAPSAVASAVGSGAPAAVSASSAVSPLAPLSRDGESSMSMAAVSRPVVPARISLPRDGGSDTSPMFESPRHHALPAATPAAEHDDTVPHRMPGSDARKQFARLRALGHGTRPQPVATRQSSAPPIVRISIGRIEVRAVAAPAPAAPRPREPTRPGVTLEHYLARKRGERT